MKGILKNLNHRTGVAAKLSYCSYQVGRNKDSMAHVQCHQGEEALYVLKCDKCVFSCT